MKPDSAVRRETARVAAGVFALVAVMLAVYAVIGKFSVPALLGGVYTGLLTVINFFVMGMTVQGITNRAAEKERTEQEIAELTLEMKNRMKLSYNLRMIALFALMVAGIAVFKFDPIATILPILFPSLVIRVLQIMEAKRPSVSEGSDKP
ncbi:MAG: hypothetical protein IKE76_06505 [Clostridia bacterium]|nr:hypothetical protein [Clostridia bacterium]